MGSAITDCPKCGNPQSYRAIVDGKPKRRCAACGNLYTIKKAAAKKVTAEEEGEHVES